MGLNGTSNSLVDVNLIMDSTTGGEIEWALLDTANGTAMLIYRDKGNCSEDRRPQSVFL
jgi:hypothetical protein